MYIRVQQDVSISDEERERIFHAHLAVLCGPYILSGDQLMLQYHYPDSRYPPSLVEGVDLSDPYVKVLLAAIRLRDAMRSCQKDADV